MYYVCIRWQSGSIGFPASFISFKFLDRAHQLIVVFSRVVFRFCPEVGLF